MQHEATPPMEPAHHPRPFGCGLRGTVGSARTRTVLDRGSVVLSHVAAGRVGEVQKRRSSTTGPLCDVEPNSPWDQWPRQHVTQRHALTVKLGLAV